MYAFYKLKKSQVKKACQNRLFITTNVSSNIWKDKTNNMPTKYRPFCITPHHTKLETYCTWRLFFLSSFTNCKRETVVFITQIWCSQPWYKGKKPYFTIKQNLPPDEPHGVAPSSKTLKASGMVNLKQRREATGISEKSEKVIANVKYKYASTQGSYESAWNKWASWCKLRQIDLFWCLKLITTFLVNLFKSKLEHRILNCYSSVISAFHDNWNSVSVEKHPLKKRIRNSCTPTPQCKLVLDIKQVLTYLENDPLNNQLSLNF